MQPGRAPSHSEYRQVAARRVLYTKRVSAVVLGNFILTIARTGATPVDRWAEDIVSGNLPTEGRCSNTIKTVSCRANGQNSIGYYYIL